MERNTHEPSTDRSKTMELLQRPAYAEASADKPSWRDKLNMKKSGRNILTIFILSFLGFRDLAHLLSQFFCELRILNAYAFYRGRRRNKLLNQVFAKLGVFEIGICFQ